MGPTEPRNLDLITSAMAVTLINCDERIRQAVRFFWRGRRDAARKGLFGPGASPFVGYFIFVEDSPASREPVSAKSPHFPTDKVFHSSSYQQRMKILCERMVQQQLYSCASVLVAPNESNSGKFSNLSDQTGFRFLLSRLAGHLASEAALPGGSRARINDEPAIFENGSLLAGEWFTSIHNRFLEAAPDPHISGEAKSSDNG